MPKNQEIESYWDTVGEWKKTGLPRVFIIPKGFAKGSITLDVRVQAPSGDITQSATVSLVVKPAYMLDELVIELTEEDMKQKETEDEMSSLP